MSFENHAALSGYDDNHGDDDDGEEDGDDDCILIITRLRLARWQDWSKNNLTAFLVSCLLLPLSSF